MRAVGESSSAVSASAMEPPSQVIARASQFPLKTTPSTGEDRDHSLARRSKSCGGHAQLTFLVFVSGQSFGAAREEIIASMRLSRSSMRCSVSASSRLAAASHSCSPAMAEASLRALGRQNLDFRAAGALASEQKPGVFLAQGRDDLLPLPLKAFEAGVGIADGRRVRFLLRRRHVSLAPGGSGRRRASCCGRSLAWHGNSLWPHRCNGTRRPRCRFETRLCGRRAGLRIRRDEPALTGKHR